MFLIHMSNICTYVMSRVRPSDRPFNQWSWDAETLAWNFNIEHYTQTFQLRSLIIATEIGTIYLWHFIQLSMAMS